MKDPYIDGEAGKTDFCSRMDRVVMSKAEESYQCMEERNPKELICGEKKKNG